MKSAEPQAEFLKLLKRQALWLTVILILIAVSGIPGLKFSTHYSVYFDRESEELTEHNAVSASFGLGDSALVILESTTGDFANEDGYFLLEELTALLAGLPHAVGAQSLSTIGIEGEAFSSDGLLLPSREQIQKHPIVPGLLVSDDLKTAVIRVDFQLPDRSAKTVLGVMDNVRQSVNEIITGKSYTAYYSGTLTMNAAYVEVVRGDMKTIFPLLILVMIVLLSVLLGRVKAMLSIFPVGVLSVLFAFGVLGWFGVSLAAINSFVPVMILSISIAGCVHMTTTFSQNRKAGHDPDTAALNARSDNFLPMSLATLTTVLGFLGLVLSPSPPVKLVGVAVALGVAVSFLLCMTLVPVLMSRLDPQRSRVNRWDISLEKLGNAVVDHKKTVALTFLFVLLPSIWLTAKNVVSDNIFEYFPASHQFSQDTRIVEQRFSGINRVLYSVAGPEKYSILSKVYLDDLERFTNWLEQQPEVSRVVSAGDISQLVEARREGRLQARLDYYKKHVSGKGPDTLNLDGINADYSATLISVYLRPLGSAQMVAFDRRSRDWLGSQLGDYAVQSGGPALLFAYLGEKNIRGMLMALSMGLIIASVLLGFALRSLRIGFIAFFCNIFPILAIYAVWAMFNGRISLGAAVVMGMILGIVVDDTIYLLTKYQQGRLSRQADPIKYALRRVGPALIITSLTLVAGLGLGLLSKFGPIWSMSLLSASIIAVALITVLLLLPALLGLAEKRQPEKVVAHD